VQVFFTTASGCVLGGWLEKMSKGHDNGL